MAVARRPAKSVTRTVDTRTARIAPKATFGGNPPTATSTTQKVTSRRRGSVPRRARPFNKK